MAMRMSNTNQNLPGSGFLGWLGRQVGHVKKAVKTDVTAPPSPPASKIVYRDCTVEEVPSPTDPNLKLRRTVIDEVIKESRKAE
jgi:hypothetical protein